MLWGTRVQWSESNLSQGKSEELLERKRRALLKELKGLREKLNKNAKQAAGSRVDRKVLGLQLAFSVEDPPEKERQRRLEGVVELVKLLKREINAGREEAERYYFWSRELWRATLSQRGLKEESEAGEAVQREHYQRMQWLERVFERMRALEKVLLDRAKVKQADAIVAAAAAYYRLEAQAQLKNQ